MRRCVAVLVGLLLALGGTTFVGLATTGGAAVAKDANCSDFSSQAAAQAFFLNHGGPNSDPDGLDADGDGIACESNPCPCNYNTHGGGGGLPAKKHHALIAKVVRQGPAKNLSLVGKVTTFKGGKVQVFRKSAGQGFRAYFKVTAGPKTGGFSHSLAYAGSAKTCFEVIAPETAHYLRTVKFLGCFKRPKAA